MNGNDTLEVTLSNILCTISPLKEDWSKRYKFIEELRTVVQTIQSLGDATVEPYGSFVSDHFTKWGDLDLCIEFGDASSISTATSKKGKQTLLKGILNALKSRGGYRRLKLIKSARVPILMFQGKHNISCDLSVNNLVCQVKSKLMYWINSIDDRFRKMVLLVKEWAKAHDINNSKRGTLNSYSLSLLVIFHFQTCVPPILPPLKEIYPGNLVDDLIGVRDDVEKNIEERYRANINQFVSNCSRVHNQSSLSELFTSFLAKFCDLSSRASTQGINSYTGQWEDIEGNMKWLPNKYPLIIEDPFEQPGNAARGVNKKQLARISETFQKTCNLLASPDQDPKLIISSLVSPQVLRIFATAPQIKGQKLKGQQRSVMLKSGQASGAPQVRVQPVMKQPFNGQPNAVMPRFGQPVMHQWFDGQPNTVRPRFEQPVMQQQFNGQTNGVMPRFGQPVMQQWFHEQPNSVRPRFEHPVMQQRFDGQPNGVMPRFGQPVMQQRFDGQPNGVMPRFGQPVMQQPFLEHRFDGKPNSVMPGFGQPVMQQPSFERCFDRQPNGVMPGFRQPVMQQPSLDRRFDGQPNSAMPGFGQSVMQQRFDGQPSSAMPRFEQPVMQQPSSEHRFDGQPNSVMPGYGQPVMQQWFNGQPNSVRPRFEQPVMQQRFDGQPNSVMPRFVQPVMQQPQPSLERRCDGQQPKSVMPTTHV